MLHGTRECREQQDKLCGMSSFNCIIISSPDRVDGYKEEWRVLFSQGCRECWSGFKQPSEHGGHAAVQSNC